MNQKLSGCISIINNKKKEMLPPLKGVNLGVKTVNRFAVEFPEEFGIKLWSVTSSDKPRFSNGEWENIKVTFHDFMTTM